MVFLCLNRRLDSIAHNIRLHFDADGRYRLECYIGSGQQADVFRIKKAVVDIHGPQRMAIKIPTPVVARFDGFDVIPEGVALQV